MRLERKWKVYIVNGNGRRGLGLGILSHAVPAVIWVSNLGTRQGDWSSRITVARPPSNGDIGSPMVCFLRVLMEFEEKGR